MKPSARTLGRLLGATLALVALAAALLGVALFVALRAAPGEWSRDVRLGPLRFEVGVLALVRIATHPLGMRALDGRSVATSIGRLQFAADPATDTLHVVCDPCRIESAALDRRPLGLPRGEATARRSGANDLHGDLTLGNVRSSWEASLRTRDLALTVALPDTPLANLYAIFGAAIPELAQARIEGRVTGVIQIALPSARLVVKPHIADFSVSGLGTEALLGAAPLPACARPTRRADAAPFGVWLPKAVVAAEDPRFFDHPGYDLAEMALAWSTAEKPGAEPPRGASTLSQQLAKLLYTGDERTLVRKLRELLYAVELDRTLGKPRLLTLYLSIIPWGAERCGAEAAALQWFGKRAAALGPIEAAWLASLLRDPDAELRRAAQSQAPDRPRLQAILAGMHPLTRPRRKALLEELQNWQPPVAATTQ
jgi:hypothetical protein